MQILITQNDQVDSVISNLVIFHSFLRLAMCHSKYFIPNQSDFYFLLRKIPLLLKCAREKDSYVSGMAAKCLGSIGAVDPGKRKILLDFRM